MNQRATSRRHQTTLLTVISILLSAAAGAQCFPPVFDVSDLNGSNGFVVQGLETGEKLGYDVTLAADLNGDLYADIVLGAPGMGTADTKDEVYVLFGKPAFDPIEDLSALDGTNGFRLEQSALDEYTGTSVTVLPDFNGDGRSDLAVGAMHGRTGEDAGSVFLVYGRDSWPGTLLLDELDGTDGFQFHDSSGVESINWSSSIGDLNGDGLSDFVVGPWSEVIMGNHFDLLYVFFGTEETYLDPLGEDDLDGDTGFMVESDEGYLGGVATADLNADGSLDFVAGTLGIDGTVRGIYGPIAAPPTRLSLDLAADFVWGGYDPGSIAGFGTSIASLDFNGDGIDDLIAGSPWVSSLDLGFIGQAHVLLGRTSHFPSLFSVLDLSGNRGFRMHGVGFGDLTGYKVDSAGDFNGDGLEDTVVSAPFAEDPNPPGGDLGIAYVVFGRPGPFSAVLPLESLDGDFGFKIEGAEDSLQLGLSLAGGQDVNGDGVDDIILGAPQANPDGRINAGAAYIVFGKNCSPVQPTPSSR